MVGSDNTAPANTDTILKTFIAANNTRTAATYGVNSSSPYYRWNKYTYRFNEGVAAGNISEVGVGWLVTGSTYHCWSRALILDGLGAPTTITILSDEFLDVYYEVRFHPTEVDKTGTVVFTGNIGGTYDWTCRDSYITHRPVDQYLNILGDFHFSYVHWGAYGVYNGQPYISKDGLTAITTYQTRHDACGHSFETYVTSNYFVVQVLTLSLAQGNFTPDRVVTFRTSVGCFMYQIVFDPGIPKTLNDVVSVRFKVAWDRA
jgi:hypothetical protein